MLIYEPMAGEDIQKCIETCLQNALFKQKDVQFTFNGAVVVCHPKDSYDDVYSAWREEMDHLHEVYINSEQYKQSQREINKIVADAQAKIDELIPQLPDILAGGNTGMLLEWLSTYTENADYIGVEKHIREVAGQILLAGYAPNAHVGKKENWDSQSSAEYIVGQAIDCMNMGMGPHPVLIPFVEKWMKQYT